MPSIIYIINNTTGASIASIPPLGSNMSVSDMRLYGLGHLQWGEGVDENLYRLTENFACPSKIASPGYPQDDTDLGPGNGINNPLNGQIWFNTTLTRMFVYDAALDIWKPLGGAATGPLPPSAPTQGDQWYDTSIQPCPPGGTAQLKVWSGVSWDSVSEHYVAKCGDTMTGFLTLNANPVNALHAATKSYVDTTSQPVDNDLTSIAGQTGTGILVRTAPDTWTLRAITTNARLTITNGDGVAGNPLLDITAITQTVGGSFSKFSVNGFGQVTANTPVVVSDISALVDSRYVNTTGDNMSGQLGMGSNKIISLGTGTAGTDAVNVNQLNAAIAANPSVQPYFVSAVSVGSNTNAGGSGTFNTNPYVPGANPPIAAILQWEVRGGGPDSGVVFQLHAGNKRIGQWQSAGGGDVVGTGGQATIPVNNAGTFNWNTSGPIGPGSWSIEFIGFFI